MAVQQGAAPDSGTAAPRLLVVESDAQTAAMAHRCLARAGFSVEVSTCVTQAMVWVERSWPDLVVLDLGSPVTTASPSSGCEPVRMFRS